MDPSPGALTDASLASPAGPGVLVPESEDEKIHPAILKAAADGPTVSIILLSASVIVGVMALSMTLLIYIFVLHSSTLKGTSTTSTASLPYITGLSQALSTLVSRSVPLVISVWSYSVAAEWLILSKEAHSSDRPTPLQ
jgi:hypothetical protein